jgi:hypothetical protein
MMVRDLRKARVQIIAMVPIIPGRAPFLSPAMQRVALLPSHSDSPLCSSYKCETLPGKEYEAADLKDFLVRTRRFAHSSPRCRISDSCRARVCGKLEPASEHHLFRRASGGIIAFRAAPIGTRLILPLAP